MRETISDPGTLVLDLASSAQQQLVVVAPFVKVGALSRILSSVRPEVDVAVVCRWQLAELQAGVCDLDVWPALRNRGSWLGLVQRLHAKIFVSEKSVLVGSSNVTGAALGWSPAPNEEALVRPCTEDEQAARRLVSKLMSEAAAVDDRLHGRFVELLEALPPVRPIPEVELPSPELGAHEHRAWLPVSRDPKDVLSFYQADVRYLTGGAQAAASIDLANLDPPPGLEDDFMRLYVSAQIAQHPLVAELRDYLVTPRRFGEVAQHVGQWANLNREDAVAAWQTLMRWLVFFQPTDWAYGKPRHSEMLLYTGPAASKPQ